MLRALLLKITTVQTARYNCTDQSLKVSPQVKFSLLTDATSYFRKLCNTNKTQQSKSIRTDWSFQVTGIRNLLLRWQCSLRLLPAPCSSLLLKSACAAQHHTVQSEQEVTMQNNPKEIKDAEVSYLEELRTAQHLALQSSVSSIVSQARRGTATLTGTVCTNKVHDIWLLWNPPP